MIPWAEDPPNKHKRIWISSLGAGMSPILQNAVVPASKLSDGTKSPPMPHPEVDDVVDNPDLQPSYFPDLDARPGTNRNWQSVEVPFRDTARLRSFCKKNDVSAISVFQAAWAMVLRCYLGNASVCFASYSSNVSEEVDSFWEPHLDLSICQIDFASAFSVSDLLKRVWTRHLRSSPQPQESPSSVYEPHHSDVLPVNTCLVYREDGDGDWSAMDRPAIRNYTSGGFEEV